MTDEKFENKVAEIEAMVLLEIQAAIRTAIIYGMEYATRRSMEIVNPPKCRCGNEMTHEEAEQGECFTCEKINHDAGKGDA